VGSRLVVRRVARLGEHAKQGQDELFTSWRYHGFVTNSTLSTVQADEYHRDHAIVEQVIAELKDGPWRTPLPGSSPRTPPGSPSPRSRST